MMVWLLSITPILDYFKLQRLTPCSRTPPEVTTVLITDHFQARKTGCSGNARSLMFYLRFLGRGGGDRTHDLRLKRPLLYH
jgi:hypothetical protein